MKGSSGRGRAAPLTLSRWAAGRQTKRGKEMSYTIEYLESEGIGLITNTGPFTHEDFMKQAREALEVSQLKKCNKFLVDCTSMIIQSQTIDIYATSAFYDEIGAPKENKIALVVPAGTKTEADLRFYETVCINRGWKVRMFADRESAMQWFRG